MNKLYFDHLYDNVLVGGTVLFGFICGLFDKLVIDGLVNLTAFVVRLIGVFSGRQLDMKVQRGDWGIVDSIANFTADLMYEIGTQIRRPQSGRIRTYVMIAAGSAAVALLAVLFHERLADGFAWLTRSTSTLAARG